MGLEGISFKQGNPSVLSEVHFNGQGSLGGDFYLRYLASWELSHLRVRRVPFSHALGAGVYWAPTLCPTPSTRRTCVSHDPRSPEGTTRRTGYTHSAVLSQSREAPAGGRSSCPHRPRPPALESTAHCAPSPGLPRDTPLCVCPTISEASDWPTQCLGSGSRSKQWPVFRGPAHRPRPLVFALIWAGRGGDALNLALGKATPTGVTERAERSRGDPSVTGGAPASRKQSRASPKGAERGRASGLVNRCHGGRGRSCGRRRGCRRPAGPGQPPAV